MRDITPPRPEAPGSPPPPSHPSHPSSASGGPAASELQDTVRGWDVSAPAPPPPAPPPPVEHGSTGPRWARRRARRLGILAAGFIGVLVAAGPVPAILGGRSEFVALDRPAARIVINGAAEGLDVVAAPGDRASVAVPTMLGTRRGQARPTWTGDTVRLDLHCGVGCGRGFAVAVPAGVPVTVAGLSGSVDVAGLRGPVDVSTSSGSVDVADVRGDVRVATSSGSIHVRAVTGPVRLEASSGSVDSQSFGGDVSIETSSGSIDVRADGAKQVGLKSSSGSIEGELEAGLSWLWTASRSGSVKLKVPAGTYAVSGTSGSGSRDIEVPQAPTGIPLFVSTTSGSVDVENR